MKINNAYPVEKLMEAINKYIDKTNRRVSMEYIMINDVNDHKQEAIELSKLLKGMNVHVNLIPFNAVSEYNYSRSKENVINDFAKVLKDNHIQTTIRYSKGSNIDGACGQLRYKHNND